MGKCVIFCAGEFDGPPPQMEPGDLLIAADGGLRHILALGLEPDVTLGDFDSLGYIPKDSRVFPVEKDDTDAMLAVRLGLERGYRDFFLYGGLDGRRLDHTVANFQTLQFLADRGAVGYLLGRDYAVTVIQEETVFFPADAKGILSLFCLGPDATGITLTGLQYPLENGTVSSGFPLGVSNHFTGRQARITVKRGSLLAMWDRKNGLPTRSDIPEQEAMIFEKT